MTDLLNFTNICQRYGESKAQFSNFSCKRTEIKVKSKKKKNQQIFLTMPRNLLVERKPNCFKKHTDIRELSQSKNKICFILEIVQS